MVESSNTHINIRPYLHKKREIAIELQLTDCGKEESNDLKRALVFFYNDNLRRLQCENRRFRTLCVAYALGPAPCL